MSYPTDEDWEELTDKAWDDIDSMSVLKFYELCSSKDAIQLRSIISRTAGRMAEHFVNTGEW